MNTLKLVVLSLLALVRARPAGFCTANTQADDIAALQKQSADQQAEIERLRSATNVPAAAPELTGPTALLIKGAGVDPEDVNWRIRAGLSPAQAVEVAALEIKEEEIAKAKAAESAKSKRKGKDAEEQK